MEHVDFIKELRDRCREVEEQRQKVLADAMNGEWHASQIKAALDVALTEVSENVEGHEKIIEQLLSVVDQVPNFVLGLWQRSLDAVKDLDAKKENLQQMEAVYSEFLQKKKQEEEAKKQEEEVRNEEPVTLPEEVAAGIEAGEIKEPSTMAGVRRPAGSRPPITLKNFRNYQAANQGEQENASDDSKG